jgi:hypothetical protein
MVRSFLTPKYTFLRVRGGFNLSQAFFSHSAIAFAKVLNGRLAEAKVQPPSPSAVSAKNLGGKAMPKASLLQ